MSLEALSKYFDEKLQERYDDRRRIFESSAVFGTYLLRARGFGVDMDVVEEEEEEAEDDEESEEEDEDKEPEEQQPETENDKKIKKGLWFQEVNRLMDRIDDTLPYPDDPEPPAATGVVVKYVEQSDEPFEPLGESAQKEGSVRLVICEECRQKQKEVGASA